MIEYNFGDKKCILSWEKFICLTHNNIKKYKSDFYDFANLYEFIDKAKKSISNILFDDNEYILENGVLHNLYGPAYIKFNKEVAYLPAGLKSEYFYINGKLVNTIVDKRGCKNIKDFNNKKIFHFKIISDKNVRLEEGVDYIKYNIDLEKLRKLDIRKNKLNIINSEYKKSI